MNPNDLDALRLWSLICLVAATFFTTLFPLLYAFSPWRKYKLGWVIMLQSCSFAAAMLLTTFFRFVRPRPTHYHDLVILFTLNAIVLTAIAVSTCLLTVVMWQLNHPKKEKTHARRKARGRNQGEPPQ